MPISMSSDQFQTLAHMQAQITESHQFFLRTSGELIRRMTGELDEQIQPTPSWAAQLPPATSTLERSPLVQRVEAPAPVANVAKAIDPHPALRATSASVTAMPRPVFVAPAAAAAPVVVQQAPAPVAQRQASDDLMAVVCTVVAEKTGYPTEMLEPNMDLEGDLGIDSIKQVEILSTLRERMPHLPEIDPAQLAELRSLAKIVAFLGSAAGDAIPALSLATPMPEPVVMAPVQPAPAAPVIVQQAPAPANHGHATDNLMAAVCAVVAEKTGYPPEMLEPEMDLEGDLGIDSIKQVEILSTLRERMPHLPEIDPAQLAELRSLAKIVAFLGSDSSPALRLAA